MAVPCSGRYAFWSPKKLTVRSVKPAVLVIPVGLIWKIRVDWTQKIALGSSLCLTFVLVAASITRVAGLKYQGHVDTVWETFWQSMSAELSVFLAAASAFRAFFVAQRQKKPYIPNYNKMGKSSSKKPSFRSDPQQAKVFPDSWSEESPATPGFEPLAMDGKVHHFPHDVFECHTMTSKISLRVQSTYGP